MPLSQSSLAAAVGAGAKNVQFLSEALNVPRKGLIIGTYDASKTGIPDEIPQSITSPEDAGDRYGFGSMLHRLVTQFFEGSQSVECWAVPQAEAGGAVAATGTVTITGTSTAAGTIYLYVAGILVGVAIPSGTAATDAGDLVETAVNAVKELPAEASNAAGVVTFTSKSKGPWGNGISLTLNWGLNEVLPAGLAVAVVDMASGAGTPDIDDALDGLGTGDDANNNFFTDGVDGYLQDATTLNKKSIYNGLGNDFVGLYKKTVARPFRFLTGDVAAGSTGLSDLVTLGNGRKTDRTNGVIAVPGSPNHPSEIAALAMGTMARLNNNRASESYVGKVLPGVIPGAVADRWTSDYDSRDTAVKAGISPTTVEGNAVLMSNVLTFYHPDSVPVSSNGYRSQRNISIIQNLLYNVKLNFSQEKWQGISIVEDTAKVTNITDRQKARDIDAVIDDLVALSTSFESHAWIYTAAFTISKLQGGGYVSIRSGGLGFNIILPVVLSGEGGIIDTVVQFDTSLAVLLAA